jgi:hypothetical protein
MNSFLPRGAEFMALNALAKSHPISNSDVIVREVSLLGRNSPHNTRYVERQNLTLRMSSRRFTRLTNGFSKKAENHAHAVALHYMHYNWCRVHQTLRVTPAMEAGLTDHVWSTDELIALLPEPTVKSSKNDWKILRRALGETA